MYKNLQLNELLKHIPDIEEEKEKLNQQGSYHRLLGKCKPVSEEIINNIVNTIGEIFNRENIKFSPIGSFNKKKEGELYNDIDLAVEYDINGFISNGSNLVSTLFKEFIDKEVFSSINDKFNTVSIPWKVTDELNVQVDFMFTDNLEFAEFVFHSPDFKKAESKYKGMYASVLLQSVIRNIPIDREYWEDGKLKEWKYYSLNQREGLLIKHKTYVGCKGQRIKQAKTVSVDVVSRDPKEIINIIFGNQEAFNYIYTFEGLLYYISSNKFNVIHKDFKKTFLARVKNDFLTDWELELKTSNELKREFENLFDKEIGKYETSTF